MESVSDDFCREFDGAFSHNDSPPKPVLYPCLQAFSALDKFGLDQTKTLVGEKRIYI